METARPLDSPVTLDHMPTGAHGRITRIAGDRGLARKLLGLGLRIGAEVSILQQRKRGVVVASSGTRVALGNSVANKLLMQPLDH